MTQTAPNPTFECVDVRLTPEQRNRLSQLAAQQGRAADALAQEAIGRYIDAETRFVEAVRLGEEALERGEYLTQEQLGRRLEQLTKS